MRRLFENTSITHGLNRTIVFAVASWRYCVRGPVHPVHATPAEIFSLVVGGASHQHWTGLLRAWLFKVAHHTLSMPPPSAAEPRFGFAFTLAAELHEECIQNNAGNRPVTELRSGYVPTSRASSRDSSSLGNVVNHAKRLKVPHRLCGRRDVKRNLYFFVRVLCHAERLVTVSSGLDCSQTPSYVIMGLNMAWSVPGKAFQKGGSGKSTRWR